MTDRCYHVIKIVGSSPKSIEGAVENAIAHVEDKHGSVRWFEVDETRGHVQDGKVDHYQVSLSVGLSVK
ncbi:MAG: dodecin flavoprotein [Coxiella sp. (in: Bacteria)]|nr:MAG: dodecin flavoprotein [Coxiella sp. (in: g-proteobacteria)]